VLQQQGVFLFQDQDNSMYRQYFCVFCRWSCDEEISCKSDKVGHNQAQDDLSLLNQTTLAGVCCLPLE
jgi:hypothetical protein